MYNEARAVRPGLEKWVADDRGYRGRQSRGIRSPQPDKMAGRYARMIRFVVKSFQKYSMLATRAEHHA